MSLFSKYFLDGLKNSIVIGVPDFRTNNQHIDMINIGNDLRVSIKKVVKEDEKQRNSKEAFKINRNRARYPKRRK